MMFYREGQRNALSTSIRICQTTENLFAVLAFGPNVKGVFGHQKRRFSKRGSEGSFLITPPYYFVRTVRKKPRFPKTMMSYIIKRMLCSQNIVYREEKCDVTLPWQHYFWMTTKPTATATARRTAKTNMSTLTNNNFARESRYFVYFFAVVAPLRHETS